MRHVFVETNWVVGFAAPAHHKMPEAVDLLERAKRGELVLHLPAICVTEARQTIRRKFQPRNESRAIRTFLAAVAPGRITAAQANAARLVLDQFDAAVNGELRALEHTLRDLGDVPGLDLYPLESAMLQRSIELNWESIELKPFDQSILAAVLVRAESLLATGESELDFCELDSDLQPWTSDGTIKRQLMQLYQRAGLRVRVDFQLPA